MNNTMQIIPQWTIDITQSRIDSTYMQMHPFKLGNYMGYFTSTGSIAMLQPIEDRAAVSSDYWAVFQSDAEQTPFFTPDGLQSGILEKAGFPFFADDSIFLFYPGGNAFSAHEPDGSEKWFYEDYVPVTAFSVSRAGCIAGFADGKIISFDQNGKIIQKFYPGGSNYEIIFGVALSSGGKYSACVSGVDRQRIVISSSENNTDKIIFHEYIQNPVFEQSLVQFSADERYVFVNVADALIIIDLVKKSSFSVPLSGKVLTVTEGGNGDFYFVLSKNQKINTVSIFTDTMFLVGDFSFEADNVFLQSDNESIYIGTDSQ
ncbi:MAG: hypothetical protein R3Y36_05295, partial [Spirochaetales bacterium]